jgi:predicted amidohydrolase YtcJ
MTIKGQLADLFLVNGNLYTQDPAFPMATAVAIRAGRIWAVGSDDEIRNLAGGKTQVIDLEGRRVLPGFQDAHFHLQDWALGLGRLPLAEVRSLAELVQRLSGKVRQAPAGSWILGQGWNETCWPEPRMPTCADLDEVAPHHPVALWRSDLHVASVNSAALRETGITADTPDPPGGVIDRDALGQPTGVLRELAIDLLTAVIPPPTEEEAIAAVRQGIPLLHRLGLTGLHDCRLMDGADGPPAFRAYQRLRAEGELPLRLWMHISGAHLGEAIALGLHSGFGDEFLRLGHVKLFADGGQGARTAWMLEPYEDTAGYGLPLVAMAEMAHIIERANLAGWSVAVHAIGDRAVREIVDILEGLVGRYPRLARRRIPNRIEHLQNIHPADLTRLAALGLVASVQPIHVVDDMAMVEQSVGARGRFTYCFRDLLQSGVPLALGSDCPVASPDPLLGIHAAVTRQQRDGTPPEGWYPAQRLTVSEAVWGFTLGSALVTGRQADLGSITPGKLADLVVLDRDILAIEPLEIADTQVVMTIMAGQVMYRR